jgi:hypothetical protein
MEWTMLTPVGIEPWLPSKMQAEGEALNEIIEGVVAERTRVNALDEENRVAWQSDHQHDRREFFRAVIACLEHELALRPRLEVFYAAKSRCRDVAQREAQDRLLAVESDIREHCGLGPDDPLPPGACQANASWHVARRALCSVPSGIDTTSMIQQLGAGTHCSKDRLRHYKGVLMEEERLQAQREREREAFEKRSAKQAEHREAVVDERGAAIQGLLEPDRPRGRKTVAL